MIWAAVAAAMAVAAYVNALGGAFVYDDFREVSNNPSIGVLTDLPAILRHYPSRPVTNFSYAVDFAIGGLDPFQYHLTNLLLHVINVVLLFGLTRELIREVDCDSPFSENAIVFGAFAAASLFAVHPMMTGAVSYISARAEVLCATLFLASFCSFRKAIARSSGRFFAAGTALLLVAAGAKETAVVLPAVLVAYDTLVARRPGGRWKKRALSFYAPVFVGVLLLSAIRVWWYLSAEVPTDAGFRWKHLLLQVHVVQLYLSAMFLPVSQSIVPAVAWVESVFDMRLITSALILGLATVGAVAARRREPLITFGFVWFGMALLPGVVLFVIADRGGPMAEHRLYLAGLGFFVAAGAVGAAIHRGVSARGRLHLAYVSLAAILSVSMFLTMSRNRLWADPLLLWQDAAAKAPQLWMIQIQLGLAYQRADDHAAAIGAFRQAIALLPNDVTAHLELARSLTELGRDQAAREVFRAAIPQTGGDARILIELAFLEGARFGNASEAVRLCRMVLTINVESRRAAECVATYQGR